MTAFVFQWIKHYSYVFTVLLLLLSPVLSDAQYFENSNEAFEKAREENKPIFLIFSGSDWCLPCMKFDKKVLNTPEFHQFAAKNLSVLIADFPQRKQQEKSLVKQNEELAERYNPQGYFPHFLLITSDGKTISTINYLNQDPQQFINLIVPFLEKPKLLTVKKHLILMGSGFELTLTDTNTNHGWTMINESIAKIKRIENSISSWDSLSQVSQINKMAGIKPVKVRSDVYELIERSIRLSKITGGAFDITFRGLSSFYTFDGNTHNLPLQSQIDSALNYIGYEHIHLILPDSVYIDKPGISIGFGAIGKGYAADKTKQLLIGKEVPGGVINASGDLTVWGHQEDGKPWMIGIANPLDKNKILYWIPIEDKSVATSGNYENFFLNDGTRYGHIINPLTGYPTTGILSVTVFSPSAELSDAMATSVFVLGVEKGMKLIEQMPGVDCIIIKDEDHILFSEGLNLYDNFTH